MKRTKKSEPSRKSIEEKRPLKIGVLAYGWTFNQYDPAQTLKEIIPFAQEIEQLGYSRFWLTEHHSPGIAWSCPEPLVAVIAQATSRIRVGCAGIQLNAHNPLKVATDFKCLATLFPGRIDLGVGSGVAGHNHRGLEPVGRTSLKTSTVLFKKKVTTLLELYGGKKFEKGKFRGCRIYPKSSEFPSIWILGTSEKSMKLAQDFGLGYCHGLDFEKMKAIKAIKSKIHTVLISIVCAETENAAQKIFDEAKAFFIDPGTQTLNLPVVVGSPQQCRSQLQAFQKKFRIDEIILRSFIPDPAKRIESFRLLADAIF